MITVKTSVFVLAAFFMGMTGFVTAEDMPAPQPMQPKAVQNDGNGGDSGKMPAMPMLPSPNFNGGIKAPVAVSGVPSFKKTSKKKVTEKITETGTEEVCDDKPVKRKRHKHKRHHGRHHKGDNHLTDKMNREALNAAGSVQDMPVVTKAASGAKDASMEIETEGTTEE